MADNVLASKLKYTPLPDSLIILAGCDSFGPGPWYWNVDSPLKKAVKKATLSGGYEKSVQPNWSQAYIGEIFKNMGNGMTFVAAEIAAWNNLLDSDEYDINVMTRLKMEGDLGTDYYL
jgi:hypothetical protein